MPLLVTFSGGKNHHYDSRGMKIGCLLTFAILLVLTIVSSDSCLKQMNIQQDRLAIKQAKKHVEAFVRTFKMLPKNADDLHKINPFIDSDGIPQRVNYQKLDDDRYMIYNAFEKDKEGRWKVYAVYKKDGTLLNYMPENLYRK